MVCSCGKFSYILSLMMFPLNFLGTFILKTYYLNVGPLEIIFIHFPSLWVLTYFCDNYSNIFFQPSIEFLFCFIFAMILLNSKSSF